MPVAETKAVDPVGAFDLGIALGQLRRAVELHQLLEPFAAYGGWWRGCSCGAHSREKFTQHSAWQWECPRALAEVDVEQARVEFARAQEHQPR